MQTTNIGTFDRADALMKNIDKSIFVKAIVISLVAHLVLTVLTSFSLFADWKTYGVKAPATINKIKQEAQRAEDDARRKKAAEEKAAQEAAKAEEARKFAETNRAARATAPTAAAPAAGEKGAKVPPEIQPLPPKKEFQLGDDLSLD